MSDYCRVCAIDVGWRNFAFCVVDNTSWQNPLVWTREDLWEVQPGRRRQPTKADLLTITHEWCRRNWKMLKECDVIVLENQLRTPFIIMNTVIQTLLYTKTTVVHPMTVASFFKLPKTRDDKKKATMVLVQKHANLNQFRGKADDLADAWIMAVHQLVSRGIIHKSFVT